MEDYLIVQDLMEKNNINTVTYKKDEMIYNINSDDKKIISLKNKLNLGENLNQNNDKL
jgi:hypothetical protein